MANEENTQTDESTPEEISEAKQIGWSSKEDFKGDPARWVDAKSYVKRGRDVMPILRANNERLMAELTSLRQAAEQKDRQTQETIEELKKTSESIMKDRVAALKTDLLTKLKEAKTSGDVENEVLLTEELADLREAERDAKAAGKKESETKPTKTDDGVDPIFREWATRPENSWFGKDTRKTALAVAIATEFRADPANASLSGVAFFDRVSREVSETLGETRKKEDLTGKVEGSRGGAGGSNGNSGGRSKSYSDLPADAKAACDKQGRSFIGKPSFKTESDWRSYYTNLYFAE